MTSSHPNKRAVLYTRLSNAASAESVSLAGQENDLRRYCETQGWEVVAVLEDDGFSGRRARPKVAQALKMLRQGDAEVLAVWKFDRYSRAGLRAVTELIEVLESTPGALFVAMRDGLRSDDRSWRLTVSIMAELARAEAENTSERVRAHIARSIQDGRFVGRTVPFGYRPAPRDGGGRTLAVDPVEADLVREAAARLLAGESQAAVVRDWQLRGVPTTRSPYRLALIRGEDPENLPAEVEVHGRRTPARGVWSYSALAAILTGAAVRGQIPYRPIKLDESGSPIALPNGQVARGAWDVVRGEDGMPLQAFPAILDYETWNQVRTRVRDPKRPDKQRKPLRRRARLLSGLIRCAVCGGRVWVTTSSGKPIYAAAKLPALCPGPNMRAEAAERAAVEQFLQRAGDWPEFVEAYEPGDPNSDAEIAQLRAELAAVGEAISNPGADVETLAARARRVNERLNELQRAARPATMDWIPTGRTIRSAWEDAASDLDRRAILSSYLEAVTLDVAPSAPGYHPDRIALEWRSDAVERAERDLQRLIREYDG